MALITFCMPNTGIELIIPMLLLLQLASCRNDTFLKAQLSKVLDYLSCCFFGGGSYLLLGCTSEDAIKILMQTREGKSIFSFIVLALVFGIQSGVGSVLRDSSSSHGVTCRRGSLVVAPHENILC